MSKVIMVVRRRGGVARIHESKVCGRSVLEAVVTLRLSRRRVTAADRDKQVADLDAWATSLLYLSGQLNAPPGQLDKVRWVKEWETFDWTLSNTALAAVHQVPIDVVRHHRIRLGKPNHRPGPELRPPPPDFDATKPTHWLMKKHGAGYKIVCRWKELAGTR